MKLVRSVGDLYPRVTEWNQCRILVRIWSSSAEPHASFSRAGALRHERHAAPPRGRRRVARYTPRAYRRVVKTYDLRTYDDVTEVIENGTRTLLVSRNPRRDLSEELERLRDDGWSVMSVASARENRLLVVLCREAA